MPRRRIPYWPDGEDFLRPPSPGTAGGRTWISSRRSGAFVQARLRPGCGGRRTEDLRAAAVVRLALPGPGRPRCQRAPARALPGPTGPGNPDFWHPRGRPARVEWPLIDARYRAASYGDPLRAGGTSVTTTHFLDRLRAVAITACLIAGLAPAAIPGAVAAAVLGPPTLVTPASGDTVTGQPGVRLDRGLRRGQVPDRGQRQSDFSLDRWSPTRRRTCATRRRRSSRSARSTGASPRAMPSNTLGNVCERTASRRSGAAAARYPLTPDRRRRP